ncbi:transmembrane channel-like protein [Sitodiplosis mosellana]|uniref:transmembrane channel-like protein n=1 Tax=Sitodiplosis mosellana TaxID=263140 RepID=UPI002443DFFE|nr:transmembrane channel-like protein [Sitodiplosis mosellana]
MSESSEKTDYTKIGDKRGILRLDINKPRNSSGSVEFRNQPELISEASPSPQSTQLSVKWAFPNDNTTKAENASDVQVRPDRVSGSSEKRAKKSLSADPYLGFQPYYDQFYMEPIDVPEYINSEDEDYSLSLSAVIQRRASVRGRKKGYYSPRRASSPMGHVSIPAGNSIAVSKADRRRSSVYTTSSGETVVSLGDGANNQESTKEQIFENIRLHKEVLQSVKMQPWSMRRKLRLVRQAREYIARHEGALQERFAMSRSTKDLWARFKIVLTVKWQHFRRELVNLSTLFVPWQLRIKEIESHFGSVVASYFTFLRWLFWVNIVLAFTLSTFVIFPEFLASQYQGQSDHRKIMTDDEYANATKLKTFLNFEGYLKYSPLFYGYYSDYSGIAMGQRYNLPLAYFFAGVSVYIYSFWATLRKMADNSRMSKMSSKEDECIFSWKLFTGWDYMIGHAETAHNRIASVVLGFKEALLEEAEKKKDRQNWEIIVRRILVNILILCLLVLSAYAVVSVVRRSEEVGPTSSYWRQNEVSFVMTGISFFFPTCFEILGLLEKYHPRKQLRWQLGRIMLLNLLNLFSLIFAMFKKIETINNKLDMMRRHCGPDKNQTSIVLNGTNVMPDHPHSTDSTYTTASIFTSAAIALGELVPTDAITTLVTMAKSAFTENFAGVTQCVDIVVNCSSTTMVTSLLALNFTTSIYPEIMKQLNVSTTISSWDSDMYSSSSLSTFDMYDENTTDYNASTIYTSRVYPMDGSTTTPIPFDGRLNEDYEATTSSSDDYADEYDDSNADERFRRDAMNMSFEESDVSYDIESDSLTYDYDDTIDTTEAPFHSTTIDLFNMTELISTTVASFLQNITDTLDPYNTTLISEQFTEFIATTISTENDSFDSVTETTAQPVYDKCIDNPNGWYIETICNEVTHDDDNDGNELTTTPLTNESPMEMRVPTTTMTTLSTTAGFNENSAIFPNASLTTAVNESLSSNLTLLTKSSSATECVPYAPKKANNITGVPPEYVGKELSKTIRKMTKGQQQTLRVLCWETLFGQELVKLTVLDLIFTIFATLFMDFFRALFVRFMNKCWCWDLEKKFPKYGDFKIAENILHLVNNQGQVWMGMFFAPGLAILNLVKLGILMYFRSWAVLTCNVPHEVIFRASRSNNFYLALLLTMLFLCVLPVSYAIVWIEPSWHCGPFANHERIHRVFTDTLKTSLPPEWHKPMDIIASPSTVIPLLLLLILIIYYLLSLTGALREANQDLKNQLRRERQEERRKMLQRVVNAKLDDSCGNNAIDRWRKVLEASSPVTPNAPGQPSEPDEEKIKARREFLARIMKKALRKSSNTSEDESHVGDDGDETDTEQHEPLPHDQDTTTAEKRTPTRRKRSSVHLLDDRKPENTQHTQLQQPQQQQQQQQQQRKLSFTRMRDIVEVPRRKAVEQVTDVFKSSVIVEKKERDEEKCTTKPKPVEKSKPHDDDYNKVNVVLERRALRRQQNARESEGSLSLQTSLQDSANYDVVNEKNKITEKQHATKPASKSPPMSTSPDIFKFDSSSTAAAAAVGGGSKRTREYNSSRDNDESDTDQTSYKEITHETTSGKPKGQLSKDSSGSLSKNASPTTSFQIHSPKGRGTNNNSSSNVSTPRGSIDHRKDGKDQQQHQHSPSPSEKLTSPSPSEKLKQNSDDLLNKPIRKLNSFLALVREAVAAKKQEQNQMKERKGDGGGSSNPDLQSRVKTYIDDSASVSMTESVKTTTTETTSTTSSSKNTTYFESIRRKRHQEPPKPKRQDSQASIWSENIPVITISKSESDECILERDNDELNESSDNKRAKRAHARNKKNI